MESHRASKFIFMVILLLGLVVTQTLSRQIPAENIPTSKHSEQSTKSEKIIGGDATKKMKDMDAEECKGEKFQSQQEKEECMNKKTEEAHLDYIYTQEHKLP